MNLSAIQVSCSLCEVKVLSIKALSNPNLWPGPTAGITELHYWRADL